MSFYLTKKRLIILSILVCIHFSQIKSDEWKEARPGEFPYMIWLTTKALGTTEWITCVGSLISSEWIIIDAGCGRRFNAETEIAVPNESGIQMNNTQKVNIIQKIEHENLERIEISNLGFLILKHSILLLKLEKPIDLAQGFAPIKLPDTPLNENITVVKPTWIGNEKVIKYQTTRLYRWDYCMALYGHNPVFKSAEGMVCSDPRPTSTVTMGPFVVTSELGPAHHLLIGMTVYDHTEGNQDIYIATDVGKYRSWIREKTGI